MDEIASALTGRKVIRFEVVSGKVPYEVVQYLESVGVIVYPGQAAAQPDGNTHCNILVNVGQYNYAAGLLAGMKAKGVLLIEPQGIRPIAPRTSWGKPTRSRGPFAMVMRSVAGGMGIEAKTPPIKKGKR